MSKTSILLAWALVCNLGCIISSYCQSAIISSQKGQAKVSSQFSRTNNSVGSNDLFSGQQLVSSNAKRLYAIHAADLDGDDDQDIVIGSFKTDKVSWFRNDGDNGFSNKKLIGRGDNIADVFCADLDQDGDMDVLSCSARDGRVEWFPNEGDGNFGEERFIDYLSYPSSVLAADLDNDGDMDIIASDNCLNKVVWAENLGSGSFSDGIEITSTEFCDADWFQLTIDDLKIGATDLDGDGDLDIYTSSFSEAKVAWYENDGNGGFISETIVSDSLTDVRDIHSADVDGDGDADLVCTASHPYGVVLYSNNGSGSFDSGTIIDSNGIITYSLALKDFDMDGDIDIARSRSSVSNGLAWYENDSAGNFILHDIQNTVDAYKIHPVDLDGDGDLDIVSSKASSGATTLYWQENLLIDDACIAYENEPQDLSKSFPLWNGVQDRVALKFYKDSPQIEYSDEDEAACDIKAWELRNLDPETGLVVGNIIQDPDTILLVDRKKNYPNGQPKSIFKWPLKYFKEGANNEARVRPNKRYQWQVRCACEQGAGQESPWSAVKFFNTPDFDTQTGTFDINGSAEAVSKRLSEQVSLWPNPTDGMLHIRWDSKQSSDKIVAPLLKIRIYDRMGRMVIASDKDLAAMTTPFLLSFDLSDLPSGVYHISIDDGKDHYSNRFIKE